MLCNAVAIYGMFTMIFLSFNIKNHFHYYAKVLNIVTFINLKCVTKNFCGEFIININYLNSLYRYLIFSKIFIR